MVLLTSPKLYPQSVNGVIVEKSTGEPLIGVTVRIIGTTIGTTTNFDGKYELKNFTPGPFNWPLVTSPSKVSKANPSRSTPEKQYP